MGRESKRWTDSIEQTFHNSIHLILFTESSSIAVIVLEKMSNDNNDNHNNNNNNNNNNNISDGKMKVWRLLAVLNVILGGTVLIVQVYNSIKWYQFE